MKRNIRGSEQLATGVASKEDHNHRDMHVAEVPGDPTASRDQGGDYLGGEVFSLADPSVHRCYWT